MELTRSPTVITVPPSSKIRDSVEVEMAETGVSLLFPV